LRAVFIFISRLSLTLSPVISYVDLLCGDKLAANRLSQTTDSLSPNLKDR